MEPLTAPPGEASDAWPPLPLESWLDTYETLHRYTQVVGKLKLALAPMVNHWWQVSLRVTPRGLTTGTVPYRDRAFSIDFDFITHDLRIETSNGERNGLELGPRAVADFYVELLSKLHALGLDVRIWDVPVEIPGETMRFRDDRRHAAYDAESVRRFGRILLQSHMAFEEFRSRFRGKCSPVHFFWGSFDLAVTRFSGRPAPSRPGADAVTREAYCDEVSSVGFWPGTTGVTGPAYYSYAAPEPPGFSKLAVRPEAARYEAGLSEFVLPYEAVRSAAAPRQTLLEFCQTTYEAAADVGHWDRERLEHPPAQAI